MIPHSFAITLEILERRDDEGGTFAYLFPLRTDADLDYVHTKIPAERVNLMVGGDMRALVRAARKAKLRVDLKTLEPSVGETAVAWYRRCLDAVESWLPSQRCNSQNATPVSSPSSNASRGSSGSSAEPRTRGER